MQRVDPNGVSSRVRQCLRRRTYSVPSPNSLWHLDDNHKLIRWRIVIHGCLDGYLRLPVFLQASTNNRASTIPPYFIIATNQYGVPSRVRCDKWGETRFILHFMLCHLDREPGGVALPVKVLIHNQRIERLWRDRCLQWPHLLLLQSLQLSGSNCMCVDLYVACVTAVCNYHVYLWCVHCMIGSCLIMLQAISVHASFCIILDVANVVLSSWLSQCWCPA